MLLFKKPFWDGLVSGAITLTFRRWKKPHVKPGGRYRCHPIGVLEVDDVGLVEIATITDDDAKRAGFGSRAELVAHLAELGPLAQTIGAKLRKMDRDEPWTMKTMALIAKNPRVVASKLASKLGRETLPFKTDVRKLKKLGLIHRRDSGMFVGGIVMGGVGVRRSSAVSSPWSSGLSHAAISCAPVPTMG